MAEVQSLLVANEKLSQEVLRPGADQIDQSRRFPRENIAALGKAGVLGLLVPAQFGGPGASLGEIVLDRAKAAQILEVLDIDVPIVDFVAAFAQEVGHHVLARAFRAARGRNRDKIAGRRQLRVKIGIDRILNLLCDIV